ncbi:MAG: LamG domain-containing protein [Thermofilaceae archaeon]
MANQASRVLRTGGLWFNGVDGRVVVPHNDVLNIAPGNKISILMWTYLTGWQRGYPVGCIIDKRTSSQANYHWEFDDTRVQMRVHAGGRQFIINIPHSLYTWNHYAMVLDGSNLYGYQNAVLKASVGGVAASGTNTVDLHIAEVYAGECFRAGGIIDDVRIYNRALTADEIKAIYERGALIRDGLVLLLDFTEGEGDIAYDKSGCGNHATIYGARWATRKPSRVLQG